MGIRAIAALQLLQLIPHIANAAILPPNSLWSRQSPEQQHTFDETTARFEEQGLCRLYDSPLIKGPPSLKTCQPKCGHLVEKLQGSEDPELLTCVAKGPDAPQSIDPNGQHYTTGECACKAPVTDQMVDGISMTLPVVDDIGCPSVYQAFDSILEDGATAIPGTETSMNVGIKAAAQAAKTVDDNDKDPATFLDWFGTSCATENYTSNAEKLYGPLTSVPDSILPSLGCKDKLCARKNSGSNAGGNRAPARAQSASSASKVPTKASTALKPSSKVVGQNTKASTSATRSKVSKNTVLTTSQTKNSATKPTEATKSTKSTAQGSSSEAQPLKTSAAQSQNDILSASASSGGGSSQPSNVVDQPSLETDSAIPTITGEQETTFATFVQTKAKPLPSPTSASASDLDPLEEGSDASATDDGAQSATSNSLLDESSIGTETSDILTEATDDVSNPTVLEEPMTSIETSDTDIVSSEEIDDLADPTSVAEPAMAPETSDTAIVSSEEIEDFPDATLVATPAIATGASDIDAEPSEEISDLSNPTEAGAVTSTQGATAASSETSSSSSCPISLGKGDESLTGRSVLNFQMNPWIGQTYIGSDSLAGGIQITDACLEAYAYRGYRLVSNQIGNPYNLVSALMIPGLGVFLGSKARGEYNKPGGDSDVDVMDFLKDTAQQQLHSYYMYTKDRGRSIGWWHSEDTAILHAGRHYTAFMDDPMYELDRFPRGTKVATYGRYNRDDPKPSPKRPCGYGHHQDSRMTTSCYQVFVAFNLQSVKTKND
ncbi:MAG: hypothetical protein Q9169_006696 [Polycauliona sp. 2 TL-2023]